MDFHPATTGTMLSDLPARTTNTSLDTGAHMSTHGKENRNSNHAGSIITKVEDILENIVDAILQERVIEIKLKIRKKPGSHAHNAETGVLESLSNDETKIVKFPNKSPQGAWKFAVLLRILEISHEALSTNIVVTKRDMFYRDPKLFIKQSVVDTYVDDIAFTLGVPRDALNIVAAAKGLIAGCFTITKTDDSVVDYRLEPGGSLVPDSKQFKKVTFIGVKWVLIVEKEATFRTLSTGRYWKYSAAGNGIVVTAKGYPDIQTRQFLHYLSVNESSIPIFALVDFDPDGLGILSTYKYGSIAQSHCSNQLAVPSIQWIGVKSTDITIGSIGIMQLTNRDRRIAKRMLGRDLWKENGREDEWRRELQLMLMMNAKTEIQALSSADGGLEDWLDRRLCQTKHLSPS